VPLLTALPARNAIILAAACLVAAESWGASPFQRSSWRASYLGTELAATRTRNPRFSSTDGTPKAATRSTVMPSTGDGSCEKVAARQASAYLDRVKARDHSAAREIARKTADLCLDAGDFKRARDWFQTARAIGSGRSTSTAAQDEQWRRRYEQGLARLRPRDSDVAAAAEARMAARRRLDRGTAQARSTAWESATAAAPLAPEPIDQQLDSAHLSWIATASAFGLFVLAAAVLLRRNGAAVVRRYHEGPRGDQ
jgi:hypothetical protein